MTTIGSGPGIFAILGMMLLMAVALLAAVCYTFTLGLRELMGVQRDVPTPSTLSIPERRVYAGALLLEGMVLAIFGLSAVTHGLEGGLFGFLSLLGFVVLPLIILVLAGVKFMRK